MANPEHVKILLQGSEVWNEWRKENPNIIPQLDRVVVNNTRLCNTNFRNSDLRNAEFRITNLCDADFRNANLRNADLRNADLRNADLSNANLSYANLRTTDLRNADFREAYLRHADFSSADIRDVNLCDVDLRDADLSNVDLDSTNLGNADLRNAIFEESNLTHAIFSQAILSRTKLCNLDLSTVKGLESVRHVGPSTLGIDTFLKSQGKIPEVFLLGCGIPQDEIPYLRAMSINPIEYNSCFISYSHKDEEFARRLYGALRDKNLRVWYAPEDMKRGAKIHEQIDQAIQVHDRLLLVLSDESMVSKWVKNEIYTARQREVNQRRRILFPLSLVPFKQLKAWKLFDAEEGEDLAREIREYYIPDFSNWKDHDSFEREFSKLLRDLRAAS